MSENFDLTAELADFEGFAGLFPLPNAVFYPQVLFPLHIFEPRYRKMAADALNGNRLIAMALLKPGWEMVSDNRVPPIHEMVCLSKITAEEKLPDGRYYLVLQGLTRARIVSESATDLPYRIGELELCHDPGISVAHSQEQCLREGLLRGLQSLQPELAANPLLLQSLDPNLPLGVFCDVLAHALQLPPGEAQRVLEEIDVARRSRLILRAIRAEILRRDAAPLHFPPQFSRN